MSYILNSRSQIKYKQNKSSSVAVQIHVNFFFFFLSIYKRVTIDRHSINIFIHPIPLIYFYISLIITLYISLSYYFSLVSLFFSPVVD